MLSRYAYNPQAYLLGVVLIHLLTSFSRLNAIEMPLELMHDSVNVPKSLDYARRMAFPPHAIQEVADIEVQMPPNVDDDIDCVTKTGVNNENEGPEEEFSTKGGIPKWLDVHQGHQHQHHPEHNTHQSPPQQAQHKHSKHHQANRQVPTSPTLRRCSVEISSKIPGICQSMGSIGNACVSGDYIDVFNMECL